MRTLLISLIVLISVSFAAPLMASAQTCPPGQTATNVQSSTDYTCTAITGVNTSDSQQTGVNTGIPLINPLSAGTNLQTFLMQILSFIIRIGTIVVILMLVYVGYLFVVARGAPGEIEAAKKALLWTIVGALVLLGAQAIASALQATVAAVTG